MQSYVKLLLLYSSYILYIGFCYIVTSYDNNILYTCFLLLATSIIWVTSCGSCTLWKQILDMRQLHLVCLCILLITWDRVIKWYCLILLRTKYYGDTMQLAALLVQCSGGLKGSCLSAEAPTQIYHFNIPLSLFYVSSWPVAFDL